MPSLPNIISSKPIYIPLSRYRITIFSIHKKTEYNNILIVTRLVTTGVLQGASECIEDLPIISAKILLFSLSFTVITLDLLIDY